MARRSRRTAVLFSQPTWPLLVHTGQSHLHRPRRNYSGNDSRSTLLYFSIPFVFFSLAVLIAYMAKVGRTTHLPSIYPHSFSRYYRQHHRRISLLVTHSDSTRSHTACIEEETFLLVKKGIDLNSQYVFTRNSSGESRSNLPSSLSPHFLVPDLAVANASAAPLVSPPFSSYFSIDAVELLFATPLPSLHFPSRLPAPHLVHRVPRLGL